MVRKKLNFKVDEIALIFIVAIMTMAVNIYDKVTHPKTFVAEKITELILDEQYLSFANNGIVDENKLNEIQNMDYADFKRLLNIKKEFCIYIEDENGNIILSKGSSKFNSDGIYCRE